MLFPLYEIAYGVELTVPELRNYNISTNISKDHKTETNCNVSTKIFTKLKARDCSEFNIWTVCQTKIVDINRILIELCFCLISILISMYLLSFEYQEI